MSFLNQNLDSSDDDEDESHLFRHSERNYEAIVAEKQRFKQQKADSLGTKKTDEGNAKRKSDTQEVIRHVDEVKRHKSASRTASPELRGIEVLGNTEASQEVSEYQTSRIANSLSRQVSSEEAEIQREEATTIGDVKQITRSTGEAREEPSIEESDDEFAEVVRQARRAQKLKSTQLEKSSALEQTLETGTNDDESAQDANEQVVEIFLSSYLPSTKPLRVKIRLSQQLGIVRQAWCRRQGFTDETMKDVFLVHRLRKVYDMSTCRSLGLEVSPSGRLVMRGSFGNVDVAEVHLQAATEEIFEQLKDGTLSEDGPPPPEKSTATNVDTPPGVVTSEKVSLVLRANGRPDFKITTKPGTSVGKIIRAYKKMNGLGLDRSVSLSFDGETLSEATFVRDTELADMDIVEVHTS